MMSKAWLDAFSKREKKTAIHKPLLFQLSEKNVQRKVCFRWDSSDPSQFGLHASHISWTQLSKLLPEWGSMLRHPRTYTKQHVRNEANCSRSTLLQRSWKVCFCSSSSAANMQAFQSILSIPIREITNSCSLACSLRHKVCTQHSPWQLIHCSQPPRTNFCRRRCPLPSEIMGRVAARDFFCPIGSVADEVPLG